MTKRAAVHRSPLGWHVSGLVRGLGNEGAVFELVRRDTGDPRAAETLVRQLVEAATERVHASSVERCKLAEDGLPLRAITSPKARRVLAVWCVVAEYLRNGNHIAQSASLWHAAIARRVRASISSVERALNALEASGVLKQWQAPRATPGVVRNADGHAYSSYLLYHVPRALVRTVRAFWEQRRMPAPRPEAVPRPVSVVQPTRGAAEATEGPTAPRAGPPELVARFAALAAHHA